MKHKATKRILSLLLAMVMLVGLLPTAAIPVFAVEESDGDVVEVSSWSEFEEAFALSDYSGKSYTIKLMNDLYSDVADAPRNATVLVEVDVYGCFVTLDFNGHTLYCTDMVSTTDVESPFSDFIKVNLHPINHNSPIEFILTDSAGGGGVTMNSHRVYDNQLAALHVYDTREYLLYGSLTQQTTYGTSKLTINGGNYTLNAKTEKFGNGTLTPTFNDLGTVVTFDYRGTVIADDLGAVEINGGTFTAKSDGVVTDFADMCARELSAFATCNTGALSSAVKSGLPVINGGTFISDGYSIHHFDRSKTLGEAEQELFPMINGGVFSGGIAYIGKTFTYSDGYEAYENKKATDIINNDAYVICIKDGEKYGLEDDLDLRDLHDATSLYVFSRSLFDFKTTPEGEGDPIMLTRTVKQSDTFEMSWTVPESLTSTVVCQPTITITRPNSTIEPKTYSKSTLTLDYSYYPNDVNISCRLYVLAGGESFYFEQNYEVDVKRVYTATDNCLHCYVAGEDGWDEVVEGGSCSFKIYPKDYYELTDPDKLEVYVNGELVTPDEDGVYTVENVTEDLDIYCDGTGFTSYSNLTVTANGKTVTEKIFNGGTYTFKTLAEFGATVPENSTFTGWKIGNKTYQPGETYTVPGGGEIAVNAVFTGLYSITVENGKAYADEAHTIPISAAAEDQVIYIVADPAPEGKVFSYWWEKEVATPGSDGWFGDNNAAETTYTVFRSDVVLAPVYETQVDNIVINGMVKPSAGVAIDNSDYSYKWGCSVPADAGYTLGICYWYDITDGEPEFAMSDGDVFQIGHTYRFKARITLYGDTILAAKEDISVALTGLDADSYTWTISEYSQNYYMVIYFEFTCQREESDTALICPTGDGTSGNPFQITNIGELYWFAAFVNGTAPYPDGVTVERNEACAIVMNDITVNPELLTEDGELNGTSGFAQWTPIGYYSDYYSGTFDGQGYTISGLYFQNFIDYYEYARVGFVTWLRNGGCVCNLTVADSYFSPPSVSTAQYYLGGIAGMIDTKASVVNCHFNGTIQGGSGYWNNSTGGIVGYSSGCVIENCTTRGRVENYSRYGVGGIGGRIGGTVRGCVNYAAVTNTCNAFANGTGGIAGDLGSGSIIRDCHNEGVIFSNSYVGGIAGRASGYYNSDTDSTYRSYILRCYNEGTIIGNTLTAGIVGLIGHNGGFLTVKNCYNAGTADVGIARSINGTENEILYCHNVGTVTESPIYYSDYDGVTNCYYLADSELDEIDGSTYKTADQFADGTVLALLNNGHWTQGEDDAYPVLGDAPGVTVSGMVTSFGAESEKTTVRLFPSGSDTALFSLTLTGTHAMYAFEGVEAGTYTMKVSKANHVTREYTVIVGNSPIPLDAKIHLLGDINGDGSITTLDYARANSHAKKASLLTGYELLCADVVAGDGNITTADAARINAHAKKTSYLW